MKGSLWLSGYQGLWVGKELHKYSESLLEEITAETNV
jgi:hypothetical protein